MAKSTRLITASYILAFVAANAPKKLRTETLAKWVQIHPTRVRNLVSQLVKADILISYRGASGGLTLARSSEEISLRDVYDAVQDAPLITESLDNPFEGFEDHCKVHSVFTSLFNSLDANIREQLAQIPLSSMFVPFKEDMDIASELVS